MPCTKEIKFISFWVHLIQWDPFLFIKYGIKRPKNIMIIKMRSSKKKRWGF